MTLVPAPTATSVFLCEVGASAPRQRRLAAPPRQEQTCPFHRDGSNRSWALIPPSMNEGQEGRFLGPCRPQPEGPGPTPGLGEALSPPSAFLQLQFLRSSRLTQSSGLREQ